MVIIPFSFAEIIKAPKSTCGIERAEPFTSSSSIDITNDGKLCHELTSPKKDCPKEYYVETDNEFNEDDVETFKLGATIYETVDKPYKCKSAVLKINENNKNNANIIISEGKYHQVKKMCKSVGKTVLYLKRVRVNKLVLDNKLLPGEYKELTLEEVELLK